MNRFGRTNLTDLSRPNPGAILKGFRTTTPINWVADEPFAFRLDTSLRSYSGSAPQQARNASTLMSAKRSNKKSTLELLYVPFFYWSFPFTFLYFGLPIYSKALGASATEIGGLFSAFTIATLILRPLVGWSLDKKGRKAFLVIGFGLYAAAMAAFALANSLSGLYLARFVQGLGAAFLWVTVYTIIADLTHSQERGQALGRLDETIARGGLLGIFFGLFILTIFPDNLGWRLSFFGYTALMGVGTYLVVRLVPETRPETPPAAKDNKPHSRQLLFLLIIVFITGASEAMLGPIYLIFLQDRFTTDIPVLALAFLPGGLITAFLASRLGSLSDRFGRVPMLTLGLLGSGIFRCYYRESLPWPGSSSSTRSLRSPGISPNRPRPDWSQTSQGYPPEVKGLGFMNSPGCLAQPSAL